MGLVHAFLHNIVVSGVAQSGHVELCHESDLRWLLTVSCTEYLSYHEQTRLQLQQVSTTTQSFELIEPSEKVAGFLHPSTSLNPQAM